MINARNSEANLIHSFVTCPKLNYYWTEIFKVISEVLKVKLDPDPKLIIIGIPDLNLALTGKSKKFLRLLFDNWEKNYFEILEGNINPPQLKCGQQKCWRRYIWKELDLSYWTNIIPSNRYGLHIFSI